MSKRKRNYGLSIADLPYSFILGALAIIFWSGVNIMDIWFPSEFLDYIKTIAYFVIIGASITIILDYFFTKRERRK